MNLSGEQRIAAPRERVWAALNDPALLMRVIPGCETLVRREDGANPGFDATVFQTIGPIQARFKGKVTLSDMNPPERCSLKGEGSGGGAGFAKGEAQILLESDGADATKLIYSVKATVGGKLAQLDERLIDQTAKSLADEFFQRLSDALASPPAGAGREEPARPQDGGLGPEIWVPGFVIVTLILVIASAML